MGEHLRVGEKKNGGRIKESGVEGLAGKNRARKPTPEKVNDTQSDNGPFMITSTENGETYKR